MEQNLGSKNIGESELASGISAVYTDMYGDVFTEGQMAALASHGILKMTLGFFEDNSNTVGEIAKRHIEKIEESEEYRGAVEIMNKIDTERGDALNG